MNQEVKYKDLRYLVGSNIDWASKIIIHSINQDLTGLYHISNNTSISKFELLQLFKNALLKLNHSMVKLSIKA